MIIMNWIIRQVRKLWPPLNAPTYNGPTWYATEGSSPFAVPSAFDYVLNHRGPDSDQTAELVSRLMKKVAPDEWTRLYREFRWLHITTAQVATLAGYPRDIAVELLGVASLNSSGHVRQAALERLSELYHARAMPYVILRLADWVPQVRQVAQHALTGLLAGGHAKALLECSFLVDWLDRVERVDLSEVRSTILTSLRSGECREALLQHLKETEPKKRFFCFRILENEIPADVGLVELALSDPSPAIRRWIVSYVLKAPEAQAVLWLPRLLIDKSVRVRTEVLHWLPETLWPTYKNLVEEQMFADSPGVRSAARFLLKTHGICDFVERYRRRLASSVAAGTLAGLCEMGDRGDFERAEAFADNPRPRIREAAIAGMGLLDPEKAVDRAVQALSDSNARVRRAGVRILQKVGSSATRQKVLPILEHGTANARLAACAVLAEMGGWEAVRDILFALTFRDATLQARAWEYLDRWVGHYAIRFYTKLPRHLATELAQLLSQVGEPDNAQGRERVLVWKRMRDAIDSAQRIE